VIRSPWVWVGSCSILFVVQILGGSYIQADSGLPRDGKKVVALEPVKNIQIEMPDRSWHNFGEDFQASLTTQLVQSEKYLVTDADQKLNLNSDRQSTLGSGYVWNGSVTPAATVRIHVNALSFATGFRGDRMFYGFDEKNRTPFNDGTGRLRNEFPLRFFSWEPGWFGRSFELKGVYPFDSRAGLDLGDGFEINALYAWLNVKYARYHAELRMDVEVQPYGSSIPFRKTVSVKGDGFFFDVAGAYQNYSGGISIARKDAMLQILNKAIDSTFQTIDESLENLPMMAQVDFVLRDGTILLGTGAFSEVLTGTQYGSLDCPDLIIEVVESNESGSVAKLVQGDLSSIQPGMTFRQIRPGLMQMMDESSAVSIQLPIIHLPSAPLTGVPEVEHWVAVGKSILEGALLPYRIARYFLYNQSYHSRPDLGPSKNFEIKNEKWAKQIGLSQSLAASMDETKPTIVAVIDSGVDYNHPVLHSSIWRTIQGEYGWDFISQDRRPYDDGYHGTQVASLVKAVNPNVQILPIKVFNPWGITNSAALYSAFHYAVDQGATVILSAWATPIASQALKMGIQYAQEKGVVVVTSAGDFGVNLEQNAYFPAEYSKELSNLVVVAAVDENDQLLRDGNRASNFGSAVVTLAAPGKNLPIAEPRSGFDRASSSDFAAALVAGAIARSGMNWVIHHSERVSRLQGFVREGRRLYLKGE
jgi:hypothetical protein